MAKTNIGRVSVVPKDEYSSTENYKRLDVVSDNGSMYISKKDNNQGNPLTDKNWWFKAVEKGEVGPQGEKPVNGVDYNTDEEKEEFKNDVVSKAIEEVEKNIADIEAEAIENYNNNADAKTEEYDTNANSKVEEYNSNATQKTNTFNENATTQTETFNNNATSKTNDFNSNASSKTDEFNTNYEEKLESINEASTSIEQERVISDGKYARALKTPVTDVESTQIYAENDVVGDLVIKGAELTQTVTEQSENIILLEDYPTTNNNGIDVTIKDNKITLIGTATADINLQLPIKYKSKGIITGDMCLGYITSGDLSNGNGNLTLYSTTSGKNIGLYLPKNANYPLQNYAHRVVENFEIDHINLYLNSSVVIDNLVIDFTLANVASLDAGIPFTPESPSLDFPSEVQVASEQNITINETNITIPLTNSAIGQYTDTIDRENSVQNKFIQELTLTGAENWTMAYGDGMFGLENSEIKFNINSKIALSNYFKFNSTTSNIYNTLLDNEFAFQFSNGKQKCFIKCIQFNSVTEWKAKLKELYDAGTPVKVYYVAETPTKNSLQEEIQTALSDFKLYQDLNNVAIDGGSMSFIYNKSLLRALEEQSELSATLLERIQALEQAQVNSVGGN